MFTSAPEGVFLIRRNAVFLIRMEFSLRGVLCLVLLVHRSMDHQNVVGHGFDIDLLLDEKIYVLLPARKRGVCVCECACVCLQAKLHSYVVLHLHEQPRPHRL